MKYIDIHTHQIPKSTEVVAIVNRIIGKEYPDKTPPYCSYGIHPWYIDNPGEQMKLLTEFAGLPQTVAIGECGLDKMAGTDMEKQKDIFMRQAQLAEKLKKPVIIHCVKAWDELLEVKKEINPSMQWIIHGFRGKPQLAGQLIKQGFMLSFGEKYNEDSLQSSWPDHLLTETDDEEIGIEEIYTRISASLKIPVETLLSTIEEKSRHIFCLHK